METTKNRICRLAKVLFNERGYDNVSLRDIAEAAGMTVGNLSYHFPKKELLILTIRENTYNDIDNFLDNVRTPEDYSLPSLLRLWEMTALTHRECGFYFRNLVEFGKNFELVRNAQLTIQRRIFAYYCTAFKMLREQGIVRDDLDESLYATHAMTLLTYMSLWQQNTTPIINPDVPHKEFLGVLMDLLRPLLTAKGVTELEHALRRDEA